LKENLDVKGAWINLTVASYVNVMAFGMQAVGNWIPRPSQCITSRHWLGSSPKGGNGQRENLPKQQGNHSFAANLGKLSLLMIK